MGGDNDSEQENKAGVTVAVAVLAGLTSGLAGMLVLVVAWLLIVWGQAPERTESYVGVCRAAITSSRHWPA